MNIIKNAEALRSNYIPEKILFREKLISEVEKKLKIGTGNILIFGETGCGKTLAAKYAINRQKKMIFVDINCARDDTATSVGKRIIETITGKYYNELGSSRSRIIEDLVKILKRKREKRIVFLFDEIDKLINKDGDHQQILNPVLESTDSNVILISNKIDALNKLDTRLMSRLAPKREFVEQYFANEILKILEYRAKIALVNGSYDLEVLAKISKWCYDTSGDIREALNLFFEIANMAEQKNCRITKELVEEAKETLEEIEFDRIFPALPIHQQTILVSAAVLAASNEEGYAEHNALYASYERAMVFSKREPLKLRQFEIYIKKLNLLNLLNTMNKTPKNRKGRLVVSYPRFDIKRFIKAHNLEE